jgi:hypothetical protein
MLARRLSRLAMILLFPGMGAAAACGSSSNPASPDAGAGTEDSGSVADVTAQDSGAAMDSGAADTGTSEAAPGDGACPPPPTGAFTQATHAPLPTVAYFGGPILTAPQIITFTFPTTANVAALQAFGHDITESSWFADVSKDYCTPGDGGSCITSGPAGLSVSISTPADTTYVDDFGTNGDAGVTGGTDLEAFINQQIAAAVAANTIPAPGPSSLYAFYFPHTTTITSPFVGTSCQAYSGYHSAMTYTDGTTPIYYAIVPDCGSGSARDLQSVMMAASHEIIEATTDPVVGAGWYLDIAMTAHAAITPDQYRSDPWTNLMFGEVGDNCESVSLRTWPLDDAGSVAQRIWSTSAAAAGHNPCVPVPAGETYYNASPDKAIYVANVGDTFTVDLSAFSDVSRPAWALEALDYTPTQLTDDGGVNALAYLQLEFVGGITTSSGLSEIACVNNGSTAQLKVTLLADPDTDTTLGAAANQEWPEAVGVVYSVDHANPQTRTGRDGGVVTTYPRQFWPFSVVTPATATANGIPATGAADFRQLAALRSAHPRMFPRHASAVPGAQP